MMHPTLVIATHNAGKLAESRAVRLHHDAPLRLVFDHVVDPQSIATEVVGADGVEGPWVLIDSVSLVLARDRARVRILVAVCCYDPSVKTLRAAERIALDQLVGWVRGHFGSRVRELTLFGSRARGEGDEDSDVDVLVAIDDLTSSEARDVAYFCGDLLTEHDVIVAPLVLATARLEELRRRERLIAREIQRDGVQL